MSEAQQTMMQLQEWPILQLNQHGTKAVFSGLIIKKVPVGAISENKEKEYGFEKSPC